MNVTEEKEYEVECEFAHTAHTAHTVTCLVHLH